MKRGLSLLTLTLTATLAAYGAGFHEAKVTQIIHDVKVLGGRAAARPASVNDPVGQGDAVRTGQESRAELTFSDLTITRLGANTVFSFDESRHEVNLDSGALLLSVPRDGAAARINSAAATAAISGGTAMFETNPGFPTKFMVLEGLGTFGSKKDPSDSVDVAAGEMVLMTPDGKIQKTKFNVGQVYHTAKLLTDFPELPNADLIQEVIDLQDGQPPPGPIKDPVNQDAADQHTAANPVNPPSGPSQSGKFGPPSTITSPDPYVIDGTTVIQTDPTITTNGVTDLGKIYRGRITDGPFSAYAFGSTSSFDTASGIDQHISDSGAVFKFSSLQLIGNPTVSTTNGETSLALIGVNGIDTGGTALVNAPAGASVLTFAGIQGLLLATQNGSINLGSNVSFSGFTDLSFYARGTDSDLFIGSAIQVSHNIRAFAEGSINVENELQAGNAFHAFAGVDFFIGKGTIDAPIIDIVAGEHISLHWESLPDVAGGSIDLDAGDTLEIFDLGTDGKSSFGRDSLTARAGTILLTNHGGPSLFDFSDSSFITFTAGTGGINAPDIQFFGPNLTLQSQGDIRVGSVNVPDDGKFLILTGSITAAGAVTSSGDLETGTLSSGGDITADGHIIALDITASSEVGVATSPGKAPPPASITAGQDITAVGGSIFADGNITSTSGSISLHQDSEGTFGNIHAGGDITAANGIFTPGDPCVVFAGGSISAAAVITGTLHGTMGITIDNTAGDFDFGIIANNVITAGTLNMINSPEITPNNRTSSGGVGGTPVDFLLQAAAIVSSGDTIPILRANGNDASDDPELGNPGNGGKVTVDITNSGLTIGSPSFLRPVAPGFDLSAIEANGGDFDSGSALSGGGGVLGGSGGALGGDGGEVHITTTEDFDLDFSGTISATTGRIPDSGPAFAGKGGTVTVDVPGQLNVGGRIEVSSAEPTSTIGPTRRSASGGNITLTSTKSSGVAVNVSNTGQLLALLDASAPGPGGKITILASGGSSQVYLAGEIKADRGTVDIRQTGTDGVINLATSGKDSFNIRGDIVKIGALGANGTLNIGSGTISADTLLKLYAGGSNGTINFNSSVTLDGNSTKIIAANTVNIFGAKTVVNIGGTNPADVYTQHANYTGSGGNGTQPGTFGGAGANAPLPLASAPPFDTGSRPPRTH